MSHDKEFQDMIQKAEQEAGFLFTDVAKELYTEGLISRKDLQSGKVDFDPLTGKISIDGTPVREALKKGTSWTIDKLLYFHRLTENHQRKWMFRTAFIRNILNL